MVRVWSLELDGLGKEELKGLTDAVPVAILPCSADFVKRDENWCVVLRVPGGYLSDYVACAASELWNVAHKLVELDEEPGVLAVVVLSHQVHGDDLALRHQISSIEAVSEGFRNGVACDGSREEAVGVLVGRVWLH